MSEFDNLNSIETTDLEEVIIEEEDPNSFPGRNEKNKFSWSLSEDGILEITGKGALPHFYGENPIVPWEDVKDQITEIDLDRGITDIGVQCFTNLKNLRVLIIPKSIRFISYRAFAGCEQLNEIISEGPLLFIHLYQQDTDMDEFLSDPDSQIITLGRQAFINTAYAEENFGDFFVKNRVLLDYYGKERDVVIPNNIREIGTYAMSESQIDSVFLPDSVETIGEFAFLHSTLKKINLPTSLKTIKYGAFFYAESLSNLDVENTEIHIDVDNVFDHTKLGVSKAFGKGTAKMQSRLKLQSKKDASMKTFNRLAAKKVSEVGTDLVGPDIYKFLSKKKTVLAIALDEEHHAVEFVQSFSMTTAGSEKLVEEFKMYPDVGSDEGRLEVISGRTSSRNLSKETTEIMTYLDLDGTHKEGTKVEWFITAESRMENPALEIDFLHIYLTAHPIYTVQKLM